MISPDHKCIFVHVPKTGGTSVEDVFLKELALPIEERGRLFLGPNSDPSRGPRRLSHFTALQLLRSGFIEKSDFESYYKFGFVRDPWDRVVSTYKYLRLGGSFKRFVCEVLPNSLMKSDYYGYFVRPQHDYLYDDEGRLLVDFVGRFERLEEDFETVREQLKLTAALPHKNKHVSPNIPLASRFRQAALGSLAMSPAHVAAAFGTKEKHPSAREYFDAESASVVGEIYKRDVQAFGYEFRP